MQTFATKAPSIYPLPTDRESASEATPPDAPGTTPLEQINRWIAEQAWPSALRALQRNASEIDDEGVRAFCYLKAGQIREMMREWDAARACYEEASRTAKHENVAYLSFNNLGYCLNRLARPGDAEVACRAAIAIHADRFNAHKNLGIALETLGRFPEAAQSYCVAALLKPREPVPLRRLRILLETHPEVREAHPGLARDVDRVLERVRRGWAPLDEQLEATLRARLGAIRVDEPLIVGGIQVFGIHWEVGGELQYQTLDEAMALEAIQVTEVGDLGRVPVIRVVNQTKSRIFLMAGEELVGAKQNRVVNASIMLEGLAALDLPVSCVESGRWSYRGRRFETRGSSSHHALRHMTSRHAYNSYRSRGTPESDQREVWSEVSRMLDELGIKSPSEALHDAYERNAEGLDRATERLRPREDWCGAAFAFGNRIAGVDLFDKPATFTRLWPKLIRAYSLARRDAPPEVPREQLEEWIRSSATAIIDPFPSPGLGIDVRLERDRHVGSMLVVDGTPVHLELFYEDEM